MFRSKWNHDQRAIFLESLITESDKISLLNVLEQMGKLYKLDIQSEQNGNKNNREIQWRWITLGLKNKYIGN